MDDDFEIGVELDRALRGAVTAVAQLVERHARSRADTERTSAAAARHDWLSERDAARRRYEPWTRTHVVEKATAGSPAAQAWAVAAAWSEMDPAAAVAERELAERIIQAHGAHPTVLLRSGHNTSATAAAAPAVVEPLEGQRALWEAWATRIGAGEEFVADRWRDSEGTIDEAARDAALIRLWDAGSDDRALFELEEHQAAMTAAGMAALPAHLGIPAPSADGGLTTPDSEVAHPPAAWASFLSTDAFESASPQEVAQAWREARTLAVGGGTPDLAAQAAAEQLARAIDRKYGKHPETLLREALVERASAATEARRDAEDTARWRGEDARTAVSRARPASATTTPYDRAAEADLDVLTPQSRQARVASSHGFSRSTEDILSKPVGEATQARVGRRGPGAPKKARSFKR